MNLLIIYLFLKLCKTHLHYSSFAAQLFWQWYLNLRQRKLIRKQLSNWPVTCGTCPHIVCSLTWHLGGLCTRSYLCRQEPETLNKATNPEPELWSNIHDLSSANIWISVYPKKLKTTESSIFILPHLFILINYLQRKTLPSMLVSLKIFKLWMKLEIPCECMSNSS